MVTNDWCIKVNLRMKYKLGAHSRNLIYPSGIRTLTELEYMGSRKYKIMLVLWSTPVSKDSISHHEGHLYLMTSILTIYSKLLSLLNTTLSLSPIALQLPSM